MSLNPFIFKTITNEEKLAEKENIKYQNTELTKQNRKLFEIFIDENPELKKLLEQSPTVGAFTNGVNDWVLTYLENKPEVYKYCKGERSGRKYYDLLDWQDIAAIRLYDYINNEGKTYTDLNLRGNEVTSRPFELIYLAYKKGTGGASSHFIIDMMYLFRQFSGKMQKEVPEEEKVLEWMEKHPSGLDKEVVKVRSENKKRIINILIDKIDEGVINDKRFYFENEKTREEEFETVSSRWWNDRIFHLRFAIRSPELLNEMLDNTLDDHTMSILYDAKQAGIPFFVNPYYLSLVNVHEPDFMKQADMAIRDYIIYTKQLINEYGHIVAWEREDIVEPGKPNAAGWILPSHHNIHRRYPEVAILIPDTIGRACGGLCASCQRMYDFQRGNLNFDLDKLKPKEKWSHKLQRLLEYFESDSQLRDILITGGDALMSTDKSLKRILDTVYEVSKRKIEANNNRQEGEKFAEMIRVRLGTRLPVYLPQRITPELIEVLAEFKRKASEIGLKQFVIQTHFESAMEVTPEAKEAIGKLLSAGWIITNQQVFTAASSRRGHTAKLRKVLCEVGVLPYYTFSVKGYMENSHNFATNERAVQEQNEEKVLGKISPKYFDTIKEFPHDAEHLVENIHKLEKDANIPFLATDRNVLNLPGVGKSLTYRTIGITHDGRRILEFDHDSTRNHSPIIHKMGKVIIIESKSICSYLWQLHHMNENIDEYESIFGYSIGETEVRMPVYEYPDYDFKLTDEITNLEIE